MNRELAKGILGVATPAAGVAASLTPIEAWMRIASLGIGIVVGLMTGTSVGISLYRKLRSK